MSICHFMTARGIGWLSDKNLNKTNSTTDHTDL